MVFLYRSDAVRAPKKFPEVTAADLGLKLACFVLQLTPLAATAAAMPLLLSFGSTLLDSSVSDCQRHSYKMIIKTKSKSSGNELTS